MCWLNKHGAFPLAAQVVKSQQQLSSFVHLLILSDPALGVVVVSAYSAGEISEATKGHAILLWTCQYLTSSVLQRGGAGKTSEACNGPAIKFDLLILLSDLACNAGEISVALKRHTTGSRLSCTSAKDVSPIMPNSVVWLCFLFPKYLVVNR